jgi:hypothetical protein
MHGSDFAKVSLELPTEFGIRRDPNKIKMHGFGNAAHGGIILGSSYRADF